MDFPFFVVMAAAVVAVAVLLAKSGTQAEQLRRFDYIVGTLAARLDRMEMLYGSLLRDIGPSPGTGAATPRATEPLTPQPEPDAAAAQPIVTAEIPTAAQGAITPEPPVESLPAEPAWVAATQPVLAAASFAQSGFAPAGGAGGNGTGGPTEPTGAPAYGAGGAVPLQPRPKPINWERLFGVVLPIWFGAIALSLAGFFFVRYVIESGAFSFGPALRVLAGLAVGVAFLVGAEVVRRRTITNGAAIASALAAASIATLDAVAWSASVLFGLISQGAGFIAIGAVTLAAIGIAIVYGQAVALVGLFGGYLAPAFFSSDEPSAIVLFTYLTGILIAIFAVIRRKSWWHLTLPALVGPVLWMLVWTLATDIEGQEYWGSAFAIAIPAVIAIAARESWIDNRRAAWLFERGAKRFTPRQAVAHGIGAACLGFLLLLSESAFTMAFWQGFLVLSVLIAAVGAIWPLSMRLLILLPMVTAVIALIGWRGADLGSEVMVVASLAAVFGFSTFDQFRRLREPGFWAVMLALVAVIGFALFVFQVAGWETVLANRHLWALGALALAAGMLALLQQFGPKVTERRRQRSIVYAAFGAATTAFLSMVAVIELDPSLFPAAAALQVLGFAAIHRRFPLRGLRILAVVLTGIYAVLILGAALGIAAVEATPFRFALARSLDDEPLLLLVLPGLAFLVAGTLFRHGDDGAPENSFPVFLEVGGFLMTALGLYYLILPQAGATALADTHIAAAKLLTPELLLCAAGIFAGRQFRRSAVFIAALALTVAITFIVVAGLILPIYWFWPALNIPGPAVFNVALLSIGVPSALLLAIGWAIRSDSRPAVATTGRGLSIAAVLFLYSLLLLEIRHAFHPGRLQGPMGSAEFYTYSVATLLYGVALLVFGTATRNLNARMLSLLFVVIATLKVFLFDASALEGLWRVLSFLGMGLAFLAISWFYARFVFGIGRRSSGAEGSTPLPA